MTGAPVSIFLAYARADEADRRELEAHLMPLKRSGLVSTWHDGCINPGQEWEPQIEANLEQCEIVLLLISKNFIASDYCCDVEAPKAIKRHKLGNACVIPVILGSCLWKLARIDGVRLGQLQALPKDAKPISLWTDADNAFTSVVEGIYNRIKQLQYTKAFTTEVKSGYPLSQQSTSRLKALQQELELEDDDIQQLEKPIRKPAEAKYQQQLQEQAAAEAERQQREEEARRQREAEERRRKAEEFYQGGLYHQQQGNYRQASDDLTQTKQLGHPDAERVLATMDDLDSEKGIDYSKLRDLLRDQRWKEADQETYTVMNKALNQDWSNESLMNFPYKDLLTIDRLWVKYSNGKYGFSVQKEIYLQCGGVADGKFHEKAWIKFGDTVEWRMNSSLLDYSDLKFDGDGPKGHLPRVVRYGSLFRRWLLLIQRIGGDKSLLSHPGL
ncbi:MAG: GUN4 domain-containing protein [Cyanobacteria bacterium P01_D01_bin.156]